MVRAELHRLSVRVGEYAGAPLRNAEEVVAFMREHHNVALASGSVKRDRERVVGRRFFHVVPAEVDNDVVLAAAAVPGTRQIHAVRPTSLVGTFWSRHLSCGCLPCSGHDYPRCENTAWCGEWESVRVTPDLASQKLPAATRRAMAAAAALADADADADGDAPGADVLSIVVGDVVAVEAPSEHDRPFELLLVREAPRTLTARLINHRLQDADGEPVVYEAGEAVVSGQWFQWLGAGNPLLYELWDEVWAANKRDTVDFTPWEGFPTVTVPVSQVVRRAIELTPVLSRSANKSGAKTIQRFLLHADTLETLEEELDA